MKITILCSSVDHPVHSVLLAWQARHCMQHDVEIVTAKDELTTGDILFLISCHDFIGKELRDRYKAALVIHASDLPSGKGWSPLVWQVLEGQSNIIVTLLEAGDRIDSGDIWAQVSISLEGHELYDEINAKLFQAESDLMECALNNFATVIPRKQSTKGESVYLRRNPENSRIDPDCSIAEQFELLRVSDPERYPAFFEYRGVEYMIKLEKKGKK